MHDLVDEISQVDALLIDQVLNAVLERYAVLFPDWEVTTLSLRKGESRNEQIDRTILMLQNLKNLQ